MSEFTDTRLFVLQRAIMALIMTHPDPKLFAETFRAITAHAQIDHALTPAPESLRQEAADFARELAEIADLEVAHRLQQKGPEG